MMCSDVKKYLNYGWFFSTLRISLKTIGFIILYAMFEDTTSVNLMISYSYNIAEHFPFKISIGNGTGGLH